MDETLILVIASSGRSAYVTADELGGFVIKNDECHVTDTQFDDLVTE